MFWEKLESLPAFEYFKMNQGELGYAVRCLQDVARLSCFIASLDKRETVKKEDYEIAIRFLPNILCCYLYSNLDEHDLFILNNLHLLKQNEIAERLGIDVSTVSKKLARLVKMGLIL
jgi:CRP-like cAMP-binding protein